ncbi:Imm26 family immunity protein [Micromonospora trifolii]|uniref:Imm26 family immunity protein n=1 Tax=Micromonospora trifolii TaxID=2911208 RepID=UPI003CFB0FD1
MRDGDILAIPVSDSDTAFARVVRARRGMLLVNVFPGVFTAGKDVSTDEFVGAAPVLVADTMDARLGTGDWIVAGHIAEVADALVPIFKVYLSQTNLWHIQDFEGNVGQKLSPAEADLLRIPKSFSPVALEKAIRGINGLDPWSERFDDLRPEWIRVARSRFVSAT